MSSPITRNTLRFTGMKAVKAAIKFITEKKGDGERWEFVESNEERCVLMKRKR